MQTLSVNLAVEQKLQQKLGSMVTVAHQSEIRFNCPFCPINGYKEDTDWHLYVGYRKGRGWTCHRCGTSGISVDSLLQKLGVTVESNVRHWQQRMMEYMENIGKQKVEESPKAERVHLPKNYIRLADYLHIETPHLNYLRSRGVTDQQISDWHIGISREDRYANRVIIPDPFFSFDDHGRLLTEFWVARTIIKGDKPPYLNPEGAESRLCIFNLKRQRQFTLICEGVFDVIGAGPHAVALYGKNSSSVQVERLLKEGTPPFYVCLDRDAIIYRGRKKGQRHIRPGAAIALAESLWLANAPVFLVLLDGKDPGELGSERTYEACTKAQPYDPHLRLRLWNEAAASWSV